MKKIFFLFIVTCFFTLTISSQTGTLIVSGYFYDAASEQMFCELLKNDSVIRRSKSHNPYHFIFDSVSYGKYAVKIYEGDKMKKWYENVIIDQKVQNLFERNTEIKQDPGLGELNIDVIAPSSEESKFTFHLYLGDSLISSTTRCSDDVQFNNLKSGDYTLKVTLNGEDNAAVYHILIDAGRRQSLTINLYDFHRMKSAEQLRANDSTGEMPQLLIPYFLYGNPQMEGNSISPIAGNLKIGFMQSVFTKPRLLRAGIEYGFALDVTSFSGTWDTTSLKERSRENYFGGKFTLGAAMKIGSKNIKIKYDEYGEELSRRQKFNIDLCAHYNLPILFHHASGQGSKVVKTRFIHQFTDVSGMIRINYYNFSLIGEVRVLDYLLGDYPELPRFRIGFGFNFLTE